MAIQEGFTEVLKEGALSKKKRVFQGEGAVCAKARLEKSMPPSGDCKRVSSGWNEGRKWPESGTRPEEKALRVPGRHKAPSHCSPLSDLSTVNEVTSLIFKEWFVFSQFFSPNLLLKCFTGRL